MQIIKLSIFSALIAFFMVSCDKDEETTEVTPLITETDTTSVDTTEVANVICDGNGTNFYFPMQITDTWTYQYKISGITQSTSPVITTLGTVEYNTLNYSVFRDQTNIMYFSDNYFRKDSITNDIYFYDDNNNIEYLYLPANPVLDQTWGYWGTISANTRKVTNLSADLTTDFCTYTDLLEISQYEEDGDLKAKDYYKKGVGLVQKQSLNPFFGGFDSYTLINITLH